MIPVAELDNLARARIEDAKALLAAGRFDGLVISGQIRLRRLDGWRQIPAILREHRRSAA
ncbi:MAG TPA: hypothetical protein VGW35_03775 [Methylomirabilota bacterium]|jgi:hypothetical protein|nr:hypothetical protein [Methylomirabilota bacterium]